MHASGMQQCNAVTKPQASGPKTLVVSTVTGKNCVLGSTQRTLPSYVPIPLSQPLLVCWPDPGGMEGRYQRECHPTLKIVHYTWLP